MAARRLHRRDVLKLLLAGLGVAWFPKQGSLVSAASPPWGRVTAKKVSIHSAPSFQAPKVGVRWQDEVLPIQGTVYGKEPEHNPLWYRLEGGGYVHSGEIQPVDIRVHFPQPVPERGALAEVTVPYTDAFAKPSRRSRVMYRLYYASTHWVTAVVPDLEEEGVMWYRIQDDKWEDLVYYVPARHLRLVPPEELTPLSPHVPPRAKRIYVDLRTQVLVAFEFDQPVFATRVSTGAVFSTGDYRTPTGVYITAYKRPYRHMATNNRAWNGYDLPGVPWVSYITEDGIALHGTYWHNDFGRPRSHGCINLSPAAAKWLFRWTMPTVPHNRKWAYDAQVATYVHVVEDYFQ